MKECDNNTIERKKNTVSISLNSNPADFGQWIHLTSQRLRVFFFLNYKVEIKIKQGFLLQSHFFVCDKISYGASQVVQWERICLPMQERQETRVPSRIRKIPWRRKWQPSPVFLLGKSHGQRDQMGYNLWGRKESDTTKLARTIL